jgi:DtxR family Mn-dependent transcriptional regulator
MRHDVDLADQDVEELVEELWTLHEDGVDRVDDVRGRSQHGVFDAALPVLLARGLARTEDDRVTLTPAGRELAARQVRRHRLAETLFQSVLAVRNEDSVNRTACVMEHVLDAELTDSICAFLGHPRACPHGKAIPPGACCEALRASVKPLVTPLDRLPVGSRARIVYMAPRQADRCIRLARLGLVPGAPIELRQTAPALVVQVGETTLALDREIGADLYVRPIH